MAHTGPSSTFVPALIVVDFQEDFCPPSGSLAVPDGRAIAPAVNDLLSRPAFAIRVATQDWHPADHISFAPNHNHNHNHPHPSSASSPSPKQPFVDTATVVNPSNPSESYDTRLWPVHCVRDTRGAGLVPELDADRVDAVVRKGTDPRVEMYSAFYDPFREPRVSDSGLVAMLRGKGVTHVYVVGLAFDYCVKATAVDAAGEGFVTYIVEDATRPVDPGRLAGLRKQLEEDGVKVVKMDGDEVRRLKA